MRTYRHALMPSVALPSVAVPAAALALVLALAGCSGSDDTTSAEPTEATTSITPSVGSTPRSLSTPTPSTESTDLGPLLTVTIDGEDVQPNAQEISLKTGERLPIEITSDRSGELHVHSTPEQYIEFDAGTAQTELVIDNPGSVEVEDHDTGVVVALIEVR